MSPPNIRDRARTLVRQVFRKRGARWVTDGYLDHRNRDERQAAHCNELQFDERGEPFVVLKDGRTVKNCRVVSLSISTNTAVIVRELLHGEQEWWARSDS